jgi:hypothetical protein
MMTGLLRDVRERRQGMMFVKTIIATGVVILATTTQVKADPIFGNNAISFTPIPASTAYTVTDNSATLVKTPLANGFSVNYTFTLTATQVVPIDTTWSAARKFSLPTIQNLAVSISGNTSATMPANNTLDFLVTGAILPQNLDTIFDTGVMNGPLNNKAINWNQTSKAMMFAVDNTDSYTLDLFSGPDWTPNAVGDKLTFNSLYTVTVNPVPEPSSVALLFAALMLLAASPAGLLAVRRRKNLLSVGTSFRLVGAVAMIVLPFESSGVRRLHHRAELNTGLFR